MVKNVLNAARLKAASFYILVFFIPLSIFCWRLKSQTVGLSSAEVAVRGAAKLSAIRENPLFLPYKLVFNLLYHLGRGHIFGLRLTSVIFGLFFTIMIFNVLKAWFGKPIALLTTLLMALTPAFLIASRTATPAILYVSSISLLYFFYLSTKNKNNTLHYAYFVICLSLCFYIPGFIWLLLISFIFWRKEVLQIFRARTKTEISSAAILFIVLLAPLIYGLAAHPDLVRSWLLIPHEFTKLSSYFKNIAWSISGLFFKTRYQEMLGVGNVPLLNAAQTGLFIFGAYVMWSRLRRPFWWLLSSLAAVVLLSGLNNNFELLLIGLPIIAFICGMGLRYLFVEWRRVFPRNPLAKLFAVGLMSALVFMHVLYGVRYSIIAWPASPSVKHTYVLK